MNDKFSLTTICFVRSHHFHEFKTRESLDRYNRPNKYRIVIWMEDLHKDVPVKIEEQVNDEETPTRIIDKIAAVLIGLINNLFFLIVSSSAQRIVLHFEASGYIAAVNWSSTICSLFASSINAFLSSRNISYDWRYASNTFFMAIGLLGCAIAPNFWVACISIVFVGFPCDFGESVSLGYFAHIKKQSLVKFWSIGTATAGVLGGGYSALCIKLDFDYRLSFYCLTPLIVIYACSYFCILRIRQSKNSNSSIFTADSIQEPINESLNESFHDTSTTPLLQSTNSVHLTENATTPENENLIKSTERKIHCCNFHLIKKIFRYIWTCDTVYFCQYVIASAFIDCAQTEEIQEKYKYLFPLLSLVQHIGVLIFCSSLHFFKFPYLEFMSFLQCANFGIWLSQAMLHWMPLWAEFVCIFFVGSVGGLSYVNTYHMLLNDDKLDPKEKELGANFTSFSVLIAVLFSSVFTLIAEKTFLKDFVPES
ncbi:CLN3 protein [Tritrichomonas foetus]|uniref:CLN3 protein n=1 Tax=Tritrichomonas foetus TaxID=1144522 RepID=A0A1J4KC25_9EUKA|nr:CLN3 protein [Tritrichomonas foetus]|eukprot:OHT07214.1 CLN3 protein [Tritrichomonas foetus]